MKISRDKVFLALAENREALRRFGVTKIGLFGSVARGEETETSDLDFLVELNPKTFDGYMDAKFFLEDLFGRKVDLVLISAIKPAIKEQVLAEAIYAQGI